MHQPGILDPLTPHARYLSFQLHPGADPRLPLHALADHADGESIVVGLGATLVDALGATVPGLRSFPALVGPGIAIPSTPTALWVWLRGEEPGKLLHEGREVERILADAFELVDVVDGFLHDGGRDLTGYEDGTENPTGDAAREAAFVLEGEAGPAGSSFVAVQRWRHDLGAFDAHSTEAQDHMIGRRKSDNEELEEAPESAHVKRTAQESFDPEAFLLRRSLPWADASGEGLVFVAFGRGFEAYEALLRRMVGQEDGITDGLFQFTRPVDGGYFWCPPVVEGHLDLSAVLG